MKNASAFFIPTLFIFGATAASALDSGGPGLEKDMRFLAAECSIQLERCDQGKRSRQEIRECETANKTKQDAARRLGFLVRMNALVKDGPKVEGQTLIVVIDRTTGELEIARDGAVSDEDGLGAKMVFQQKVAGNATVRAEDLVVKSQITSDSVPVGSQFPQQCYRKLLDVVAMTFFERLADLVDIADRSGSKDSIRTIEQTIRHSLRSKD